MSLKHPFWLQTEYSQNYALSRGLHVHTADPEYGVRCVGGDSTCELWHDQLFEFQVKLTEGDDQ